MSGKKSQNSLCARTFARTSPYVCTVLSVVGIVLSGVCVVLSDVGGGVGGVVLSTTTVVAIYSFYRLILTIILDFIFCISLVLK